MKSVYHGTEIVAYLGPKTWDISTASLSSFRDSIRKWVLTVPVALKSLCGWSWFY